MSSSAGSGPVDVARTIDQHRHLGRAVRPGNAPLLDHDIGMGEAVARAQQEIVDHLAAAGQVADEIERRHLVDHRQQFRIDRSARVHWPLPGDRPIDTISEAVNPRRAAEMKRAEPRPRPVHSVVVDRDLEIGVFLVADEAHLLDVGALGDREHLVDHLVARLRIGLEVQLRDGFICCVWSRDTGAASPADRAAVPQT